MFSQLEIKVEPRITSKSLEFGTGMLTGFSSISPKKKTQLIEGTSTLHFGTNLLAALDKAKGIGLRNHFGAWYSLL